MSTEKNNRSWLVLVTAFVLLLIMVDWFLIRHEHERRLIDAKNYAQREAVLLASVAQEALATQNYQLAEYLFSKWSAEHPDVIRVALVKEDNATILEYTNLGQVAIEPFETERQISYGYQKQVRLVLVKDLSPVSRQIRAFGWWVVGGTLLIGIVLAQVLLLIVRARERDLIAQIAHLDGLTGIPNRRHFDETLSQEWRRAQRSKGSLALIMIDVDFFKAYNDAVGHQEGDNCLRSIAQTVSQVARRPGDVFARYGGEEFVAVLPDTALEGARHIAQLMQDAVEKLAMSHPNSPLRDSVTVSIGLCATVPVPGQTAAALLKSADSALYRAKSNGRNCIEECQGGIDHPKAG